MLMEPISKNTVPARYESVPKPPKTPSTPPPSTSSHIKSAAPAALMAPLSKAGKVVKAGKGAEETGEVVEEERLQATEKQVQEVIQKVSRIANDRTRCEFSYHEGTRSVSIKVVNDETNEVIREIPPEKILDMIEKMVELLGIFVDEKR